MDCFEVEGGRRLEGSVEASGSKNATLPLLATSLLLEGRAHFSAVPDLDDVRTMVDLLEELGVLVRREDEEALLEAPAEGPTEAPYDIVRRMRASICVLGPLLARRGAAKVPLPGGCVFGLRPVDLHVRGLRALGATIEQENGCLVATAPADGLRGAAIDLCSGFGSTVLGTINVMAAACLASGESVIRSAAREPEVVEVARYLRACGALIDGEGSDRIRIQGVSRLQATPWRLPADRIETGTLLLAAAITCGHVRVTSCRPQELQSLTEALAAVGLEVSMGKDWMELDARSGGHGSLTLETAPFPGFPTDLQAQWLAFATQSEGRVRLTEKVYPERFMHVPELQRLGARIERQGETVTVHGSTRLTAAPVLASDLRASACLVLAGMAAEGQTIIRRVYHLDRGYVALERKLQELGGSVHRRRDVERP
ncbi:MAG: UDP-N-acetylglucosamine 1-carboxyvinyltransferase [Planctomycetota bacterium]|jgi:UDP-N-acetylglucosamine 1-carboxyvinyltransferase